MPSGALASEKIRCEPSPKWIAVIALVQGGVV